MCISLFSIAHNQLLPWKRKSQINLMSISSWHGLSSIKGQVHVSHLINIFILTMATIAKIELEHLLGKSDSNTELLPFHSASPIAAHFLLVRCNGITYFSYRCCKKCKRLFIYNSKSTTNLKRHFKFCMGHQSTRKQTINNLVIDNRQEDSIITNASNKQKIISIDIRKAKHKIINIYLSWLSFHSSSSYYSDSHSFLQRNQTSRNAYN